jgi:anaerobic C4-dicarboxylate transporter
LINLDTFLWYHETNEKPVESIFLSTVLDDDSNYKKNIQYYKKRKEQQKTNKMLTPQQQQKKKKAGCLIFSLIAMIVWGK